MKGRPRVLIIDDDRMARKILFDILMAKGYEPIMAGTGAEGAEAAKKEFVNVALIDLRLPDITGTEVVARIKSISPSTEAIILTGHATMDSAIEAANVGAFSYLQKPYAVDQLLIHLRHALEKQRTEEMLHESEERFRKIFEEGPLGMAIVGMEQRFIKVNATLSRMLGYAESDLAALTMADITHPDDVDATSQALRKLVNGEISHYSLEKRYIRKDGQFVWANVTSSIIRDMKGNPLYVIGMLEDIAERKALYEKLRHDAVHDALTGLSNRTLFTERLASSLGRMDRQKDYALAVLFLDLDRFKNVNDSLGHVIGDQLLLAVAERLKKCVRPYDTIARLGGDEFAILLEAISGSDEAVRAAERIIRDINSPFRVDEHEVFVTASIGIVLSRRGYREPEHMLRDADIAMYQAKVLNKNCYVIFNEEMHDSVVSTLKMENDLRRALRRQELLFHYQPIVSMDTGKIAGFEALLRWKSQEGKMVPPMKFIPMAEETGLIIPIGEWALQEACRQARSWQQKFPASPPLGMSINLSSRQFKPVLIDQVKKALRRTGLSPETLRLEITESTIMDNPETAATLILRLREINVKVHIDDFGTGYSSLSYLHKFYLDALKIDRSFISAMRDDEYAMEIVRTVIAMAHSLKKHVIAEGVETAGQFEELRKLGCEYFQGYLFSKPLDSKEAEELLRRATRGKRRCS